MDFTDPHFVEPTRLLALLPAALVLAGLFLHARRARRASLATVAAPAMLARLLSGHSPARRALKSALLSTGVALVILALARPCWGVTENKTTGAEEDILFVIDTSRSMTARDVAPSRLERAKRAVETFVGLHGSGRVGLVAFAGEAFVQCPPTADREIFSETLDALDTGVIPTPGTDIGAALETAFKAFGEKKGQRTVILLTDGEDLEADGVETARKLARDGIVVHTVGIGGTAGAAIPSTDGTGPVVTRLDEKTLRDIAEATHGKYFRIDGAASGFLAVEAGLEKATSAGNTRRTPVERFAIPLAAALALFAAEGLVGTRRSRVVSGKPLRALAPLVILAFFIPPSAFAGEAEKLYDEGTRAIAKGSFVEAESSLRNAVPIADDKLKPRVLANLGQARARIAAKAFADRSPGGDPATLIEKATRATDIPMSRVDKALSDKELGLPDTQAGAEAYNAAYGARKAMRKQLKDLDKALADGPAAEKTLERARDDFSGADELDSATPDAAKNARAVADYLARVKKTVENEREKKEEAQKRIEELNKKMKELKKQIPQDQRRSDDPEGDGDDEGEEPEKDGKKKNDSKKDDRTEKERREQEGKESKVSREEALAALEALRNENKRRVDIGSSNDGTRKNGGNKSEKSGKDW